jgi:hypothetical protein
MRPRCSAHATSLNPKPPEIACVDDGLVDLVVVAYLVVVPRRSPHPHPHPTPTPYEPSGPGPGRNQVC